MILLYQKAADNCIKLANAYGRRKSADMRKHLNSAKKYADDLLKLDRNRKEVYDTRGCTLEDMAWLREDPDRLGPTGKYAQAVDDFTKAIGGFGSRAAPYMHRGRCRFKWAEDESKKPGATGPDLALLTEAENDLNLVFTLGADTPEAAEAYYWKAQIARFRRDTSGGGEPAELYAQAAEALKKSAELSQRLRLNDWAETALKEWAVAAYYEADRQALNRNQAAKDALEDALARAEALREFSPPWAAFMTMLLRAEVQKKLDPARDTIPDAIAAGETGLAPDARAQDKWIQFRIRLNLVDYRTSIITANAEHKDGPKALADAKAALALVAEAGLPDADKAEAYGARGMAYVVIFEKSSNPADSQEARKAFQEAVRLAPDHAASWRWKTYLGIFRVTTTGSKTAEEEATRLAEGYRLFREAEVTNPRKTDEELAYDKYLIRPQREAAEKAGLPYWADRIDKAPNHPDRPTWLLAAAESLALSGADPAKAKRYFEDGKKAVADLPEGQREIHRRQIERIKALLK